MRRADLIRAGYSPSEAHAEALRRFGDASATHRACYQSDLRRERSLQRKERLSGLLQDLKLALRQLRHKPLFASAVVLTLAVGIGSTTAVFSTVDHVLLRPLPFTEPDRIVTIWETDLRTGERRHVSPGTFLSWKERATTFSDMGLVEPWGSDLLRADAPPEELPVYRVSAGFVEALGPEVVLGRSFTQEEFDGTAFSDAARGIIRDHSGTGTSVLLSESSWRARFGGDSSIVGAPLDIDGVLRTVVGVVSSEAAYPEERPLLMPKLFSELEREERAGGFMEVVGRLRPGVTLAQARADMDRVAREIAAEHPDTNGEVGAQLVPLEQELLGNVRPALLLLLGAVTFVLAVACANVAGLMLARGSTRRQEVAVRRALGAGRARLVRQLLAENVVLGAIGGLAGIALAGLVARGIMAFGPGDVPRLSSIDLDGRVLTFAGVMTLLSVILSGLLPSLRASGKAALGALAGASRSDEGGLGSTRMRSRLVAAEVAISLVLLIGAGLLGRSFVALLRSDLGFQADGRVAVQAFLWDRNPLVTARIVRANEVVDAMSDLPEVDEVAIALAPPFHPYAYYVPVPITVVDRPYLLPSERLQARPNVVSANYFHVMGIPLLAGRSFDAQDRLQAPRVVIINEAMARSFFAGDDPLGERLMPPPARYSGGSASAGLEIVGVVADVRQRSVDVEPVPEFFVPFEQSGDGGTVFIARTRGDAAALVPRLRQAVLEVDPGQPVYHATTLEAMVSETLGARRFSLLLLGAFALIGVALASVGLYAAISYTTGRRTKEIGVRMALGSTPVGVTLLIVGQGLKVGLTGVAIGVALSLALARLLRDMLYQVEPADPLTFIGLTVFMLLVIVSASWLPARRGARLEPVRAMRES